MDKRNIENIANFCTVLLFFFSIILSLIYIYFLFENTISFNFGSDTVLFLLLALTLIIIPYSGVDYFKYQFLNKWKFNNSFSSDKEFLLVLRSFNAKIIEEIIYERKTIDYTKIEPRTFTEVGLNASNDIINRIRMHHNRHKYNLVLLGKHKSYLRNVIILDTDSLSWYSLFKELAKKSKAIFILPGYTKGTVKEIKLVRKKYLDKAIFIMPNSITDIPKSKYRNRGEVDISYHYSSNISMKFQWEELAEEFRKLFNFHLPKYQDKGQYFIIDEKGNTVYSEEFTTMGMLGILEKVKKNGKSFKKTINKIPNNLYINTKGYKDEIIFLVGTIVTYVVLTIMLLKTAYTFILENENSTNNMGALVILILVVLIVKKIKLSSL